MGVSFHVGSGASNPAAFSEAIETARKAFDEGLALGLPMSLLDIGGGFSGGNFDSNGTVHLGMVPEAVNAALDLYFPESAGVHIIAEPGRYFAEACAHLACLIFGVRPGVGLNGLPTRDYWYIPPLCPPGFFFFSPANADVRRDVWGMRIDFCASPRRRSSQRADNGQLLSLCLLRVLPFHFHRRWHQLPLFPPLHDDARTSFAPSPSV